MGSIISVNFQSKPDSAKLVNIKKSYNADSRRTLADGMIQPAEKPIHIETANEHTAEPIKSIEDINRISQYLLNNQRYRDNMLFIVGINFGLRISDLLQLRFSQLINEDYSFKTTFPILEKKTKNTRKVQRNRYISINDVELSLDENYINSKSCEFWVRQIVDVQRMIVAWKNGDIKRSSF